MAQEPPPPAAPAPTTSAPAPATAAPPQAPGHPPVRNGAVPTLERRMQAMTKELKLDSGQQVKVRKILEEQRDAVRKIWSNPAIMPAERAAVTQAQTEHTGDAIRALLDEEQLKLYNRSRKDNPLPAADQHSVEEWMDTAHPPHLGPQSKP